MKRPRVEDFDPQSAPQLGSPLDRLPAIQRPGRVPPVVQETPAQPPPPQTIVSPPVRPYGRTPVRRVITRYAFEFFQDQIEALRNISLREKMQGEKGSMSEMVREALDGYLADREPTGTA